MSNNIIKPQDIEKIVRLNAQDDSWKYNENELNKDNFTYQYEGVAGIINRITKYNIALSADEVGMGKTYQALSVIAYYYNQLEAKEKKIFEVLVITPNDNVMKQWESEYKKFRLNHLQQNNNLPDETKLIQLPNFEKGFKSNSKAQITFAKTSSFQTAKKNYRIEECEKDIQKFDFVIIDEAHYYRNYNPNDEEVNSNRVTNAQKVFSEYFSKSYSPKMLLLTATPMHSRDIDPQNIMKVLYPCSDLSKSKSTDILEKIMIRRLKVLVKGKNKYNYRKENGISCELSNSDDHKNELFFVMLQKIFVASAAKNRDLSSSKHLLDFFEGVDFEEGKSYSNKQINEENREEGHYEFDNLYKVVIDKFKDSYSNELPSNSKYQNVINNIIEDDKVKNDEKALTFVRRKASAKNLVKEYIRRFDEEAWSMILKVLPRSKNISKNIPSRDEFSRILNNRAKTELDYEIEKIAKDSDIREVFSKTENKEYLINGNISNRQNQKIRENLLYEYYHENETISIRDKEEVIEFINNYAKVIKSIFETEEYITDLKDIYSYFDIYGYSKKIDREKFVEIVNDDKKKIKEFHILDHFKAKKVAGSGNDAVSFRKRFTSNKRYRHFFEEDLKNILYANNNIEERNIWKKNKLLIKSAILNASIGLIELYVIYLKTGKDYNKFLIEVEKQKGNLEFVKELREFIKYFKTFVKLSKEYTYEENDKTKPNDEKNQKIFYNASPAYGYTSESKSQTVLDRFNSPFFPKVLCGTSTLQEGVNLQGFCDRVYHFGAAHTMGDDEQRIGRVDRMDGKFQRKLIANNKAELNIYYPYLKNTFDEHNLKNMLCYKRDSEVKVDKCIEASDQENIACKRDKLDFLTMKVGEMLYQPDENNTFDNESYGWKMQD